MHGQSDVPLNSTGKEQALKLALSLADIKFDICYCSPLQRAVETAQKILKFHSNVPLYFDDRLMEIYKGDLEGTHNDSEKILKHENVDILMAHNIESKAHFFKRVKSFLDEIITLNEGKNILLVCHSGTVKMCNFYFNPVINKSIVDAYYDLHIQNCGVYEFDVKLNTTMPKLVEYQVDNIKYPLI